MTLPAPATRRGGDYGCGRRVPFAWVGKLCGARVVYVESLSRIDGPSLSLSADCPGGRPRLRPVARARAQCRALATRGPCSGTVIFVTIGTSEPFDRLDRRRRRTQYRRRDRGAGRASRVGRAACSAWVSLLRRDLEYMRVPGSSSRMRASERCSPPSDSLPPRRGDPGSKSTEKRWTTTRSPSPEDSPNAASCGWSRTCRRLGDALDEVRPGSFRRRNLLRLPVTSMPT